MPAMLHESLPEYANQVFAQLQADFPEIVLFSLGIALYGLVVFHYYRILARRDIFHPDHFYGRGAWTALLNFLGGLFYIFKYLVLFPLVTFVLFGVFSFFLFFLAKEQSLDQILLISITMISATRIAAYYNEQLAQDLGKLIPLALLGVFIVQPNFFSIELFYARIDQVPSFLFKVSGFILFTLALEVVLKVLLTIKLAVFGEGKKKAEAVA